MEHIDLIRKIAWSFHRTTGLEWEDLFQQAVLTVIEYQKDYDPERGCMTNWITQVANSGLMIYIKRQGVSLGGSVSPSEEINWLNPESDLICQESFARMSEEAKAICRIVLHAPGEFLSLGPKRSRGMLTSLLRKEGWKWKEIWRGMNDIKSFLNEIQ
jgi:hypothetical protein